MDALLTAAEPEAQISRLLGTAPHRLVAGCVTTGRWEADLRACLDLLADQSTAADGLITESVAPVVSGGKRLRPLLALATAYATWCCAPDGAVPGRPAREEVCERAVRGGAVAELLHLASLVHDDVMDEADVRHGAPTVNVREGNIRAVLAGDFLLARALAVAGDLGPREGALGCATFVRLCEGQARESATLFDPARTEDAYYEAITGKTAALLSAACRLGAMAAGVDASAEQALADYGHHLGLAYQLVDDLLDLTGPAYRLGKPAGHDLVEGVFTLPVLHAVRERPRLAGPLAALREDAGDGAVQDVLGEVLASGGPAYAWAAVAEQTRHAAGALSAAAGALTPAGHAMLSELVTCLAGRTY